jgi:hypothetical protein
MTTMLKTKEYNMSCENIDIGDFDPDTKRCTMNCGKSCNDKRTWKEIKFSCDDCETVGMDESMQSHSRDNDISQSGEILSEIRALRKEVDAILVALTAARGG